MTCMFGDGFRKMVGPMRPFIMAVWTPSIIFSSTLVFSWMVYAWETYLTLRQYKIYKNTRSVPLELAGVMDQDTLLKAKEYNVDKTRFGMIYSCYNQILATIILLTNALPWIWGFSGQLTKALGFGSDAEIVQTVVFANVGSVFSVILDLPWSLYNTFVIEERHGFNKQTLGFYFKDKAKKTVIGQAIMSPVLAIAVYIIKKGGDYFFLYLWAFCFVIAILLITVYPDYIAPLFDKFTPLPEGELRSMIEKMADSISFPLKKIYVVEGSKRSSHSNAYFYGFMKNKRIVLFDTLIEGYKPSHEMDSDQATEGQESPSTSQNEEATSASSGGQRKRTKGCNNNEICAVLAHELGHWKENHVLKNMFITEVNLFVSFLVFGMLYKDQTVYDAFGFRGIQPVFIGLYLIFQFIFSPYNEVLSFLMTCLNRRFEFAADAFAKGMHRAADLRSALIKINTDNLGFPVYDNLSLCGITLILPYLKEYELSEKLTNST